MTMPLRSYRCLLLIAALLVTINGTGIANAGLPAIELAQADAEQTSASRYWTQNLKFDDIDLQQLQRRLKWLRVELPFPVEGSMSVQLQVSIPINQLQQAKLYRATGSFQSKRLTIDGLEVRDFSAGLTYRDGVLTLQELRLRVPDNEPVGKPVPSLVTGNARLELLPRGELTAQVSLERVPLRPFAKALKGADKDVAGRATGQLKLTVPGDKLPDLSHWNASGNLRVEQFIFDNRIIKQLQAAFTLKEGLLRASSLQAVVGEGSFSGAVNAKISAPYAFKSRWNIDVKAGDLADLFPAEAKLPASSELAGQFTVEGQLSPINIDAAGSLGVGGLKLNLSGGKQLDAIRLVDLTAALKPVAVGPEKKPAGHRLKFQGDELRLVGADAGKETDLGRLAASADVTIPPDAWGDPAKWRGTVGWQGENLTIPGTGLTALSGQARFAEGHLELADVAATGPDERLTLEGRLKLADQQPFSAEVNWTGGRVDALAAVVASLDFLPAPIKLIKSAEGRFQLSVQGSGRLTPFDAKAAGKFSADGARLGKLDLQSLSTRFTLESPRFTVQDFAAEVAGGSINGSAVIPLDDQTAGTIQLEWDNIQPGVILSLATPIATEPQGTSSANLQVAIPPGRLSESGRWTASGKASIRDIGLLGYRLRTADLKFALADETLKLQQFDVDLAEGRFTGNATVGTTAPHTFDVAFKVDEFNLSGGNRLPEKWKLPLRIGGVVSVSGEGRGTLQPLKAIASGTVSGDELQAGPLLLSSVQFGYAVDEEQLSLSNFQADVFDGAISGGTTWPLTADDEGKADFSWKQLNLARMSEELSNFPIAGILSGNISASVPTSAATQPAAWSGALTVDLGDLQYDGEMVGDLGMTVALKDGLAGYKASGGLFGGSGEAEGELPLAVAIDTFKATVKAQGETKAPGGAQRNVTPSRSAADAADGRVPAQGTGSLKLQNIQLQRLTTILRDAELSADLEGRFDLTVDYQHGPDDIVTQARGEAVLTDVRYQDRLIVERAEGAVALNDGVLTLSEFNGSVAGGRAALSLRLPLKDGGQLTMSTSLRGFQIEDALQLGMVESELVEGTADLRLTGRFGMDWFFTGALEVREGKAGPLPFRSLRLPLVLQYYPGRQSLRMRLTDISGTAALGRISGSARVDLNGGLSLNGDLKFRKLHSRELFRASGATDLLGRGIVSGNVSFSGKRVTGLDDIVADVTAQFGNTQTTAIPVIGDLNRILSIPASTTFKSGEVRGRLSKGLFRIRKFFLSGPTVRVWADGSVSTSSRLNLNVTAMTGDFRQNSMATGFLLEQLLITANPSIALLRQANEFLSNRTVTVKVTGTIRRPTMRVQPLQLLSEEALRYFLQTQSPLL